MKLSLDTQKRRGWAMTGQLLQPEPSRVARIPSHHTPRQLPERQPELCNGLWHGGGGWADPEGPTSTPRPSEGEGGSQARLTTFSILARSLLSSILFFSISTSSLVPLSTMTSSSWKAAPHWAGRKRRQSWPQKGSHSQPRVPASSFAKLRPWLCLHLSFSSFWVQALVWEIWCPKEF